MTPRVRQLLDDLADCKRDLAEALTADQAADARASIRAIRHSLFLAGHTFETEDA